MTRASANILYDASIEPLMCALDGVAAQMSQSNHDRHVTARERRLGSMVREPRQQALRTAARDAAVTIPGSKAAVGRLIDLFHNGATTVGGISIAISNPIPTPRMEGASPVLKWGDGIEARIGRDTPHHDRLVAAITGQPIDMETAFIQLPASHPFGKWKRTDSGVRVSWSGAKAWQPGFMRRRIRASLNWIDITRDGADVDLEWTMFWRDWAANKFLTWG